MTSSVYTLQELVDIALQTPEIGAVNFNVLRIVLLKILSELKFENITANWKPAETSSHITKILEDKELPDHPISAEAYKKETNIHMKYTSEKVTKSDDTKSPADKAGSPQSSEDKTEDSSHTKSETSTDTDEKELKPPLHQLLAPININIAYPSEPSDEKRETTAEKQRKEEPEQSKSLKAGTQLWQMWQMKKSAKRIEGIEEIVNSLASNIDELMEFKDSRSKRIKFEEGEKFQSAYQGATVSREEFEDTVDDIGEAMSRVTFNQRQQKDQCNTISQSILKEMSLKASVEDLSKHVGSINKNLRTLGLAVRNIQKLIKDVIYPEACGITKCMTCGRKSHLPLKCVVMDTRRKSSKDNTGSPKRAEINNPEINDELKFTKAALGRIRPQDQESHLDGNEESIDNRPIFPEYLIQLEPLCEIDDLTRNFAPLRRFPDLMRRNTICIPALRPKQDPVSISLLEDDISKTYCRQ